jgi:hypothetical protein
LGHLLQIQELKVLKLLNEIEVSRSADVWGDMQHMQLLRLLNEIEVSKSPNVLGDVQHMEELIALRLLNEIEVSRSADVSGHLERSRLSKKRNFWKEMFML